MKTTKFVFALSSLLISGALLAEEGGSTPAMSSEVQRSREMVQEFRTETIRSEMHFTDKEAADFWPLYEKYRARSGRNPAKCRLFRDLSNSGINCPLKDAKIR